MYFDLVFHRKELEDYDLSRCVVVVADVLRATTVMIRALENGAMAVFPQADEETAQSMYTLLNEQGLPVLLCGEKDGFKRPGYQLGNSPREYTADMVEGKTIIHLTTNGTRALKAASDAHRVFIASFLNMSAVANRLAQYRNEVDTLLFVSSGRENRYCLEDTVCLGGVIAAYLEPPGEAFEMSDSVRTALDLYHLYRDRLLPMVQTCSHGAYLIRVGLEEDLPECVQVNTSNVVPAMKGNRISLQG